ncbi:type II toxin-antitoxin system RelE family toxin [Trichothermofontia sp.]
MASDRVYRVVLTVEAQALLAAIKDRREQQLIVARLEKLKSEPEKQGKALSNELAGYRSVRAVGQRYRIVYRVNQALVTVVIVGMGRRREGEKADIYAIVKRMQLDWQEGQVGDES